jgi:putative lipoic acid-binding regulatory protein
MSPEKPVLEFPCSFSIKVIGEDWDDYQQFVIDTMHACGVTELGKITSRVSTKNKYLAVTVPFTAQSREQLDTIAYALNQDIRTCYII